VPLDTYVVDDGWANYESFWEFNEKFPLGLSRIKDQVAGYGTHDELAENSTVYKQILASQEVTA